MQNNRRLKFTSFVFRRFILSTFYFSARGVDGVIRGRILSDGVGINGALSPLLEHEGRGVPRQKKG